MPLADRVVVRLDDMMRRGMQRRQHMRQFVEIRQILQRRIAAHVVQIAQVGRPGHRHEDCVVLAEGQAIGRIARVIGECLGDRGDELAHQPPIQIDGFIDNLGPGPAPVRKRNVIAEMHAHIFKDMHRGRIDPFDLLGIHRLREGQVPL